MNQPTPRALLVTPVTGVPPINAGDDLASLFIAHADSLQSGDIVVVASKVVSKAEGRAIRGASRGEVIAAESADIVARRGDLTIARTRHGLVLAAAGVDASNVEPGTLLPLPEDPDRSARAMRSRIADLTGTAVGIVISDTAGRPWRLGQTDIAIGAAGVTPIVRLVGTRDMYGNVLQVTAPAVADEIAAAAHLVMEKSAGIPFAVVRGLSQLMTEVDGPGASSIVRPTSDDLFVHGTIDKRGS